FIGIRPRTPADGAGDHHQQRDIQAVRCKHRFSLIPQTVRWMHATESDAFPELVEFSNSLATNSRNKQLKETIGINIHADFRVGRNLIYALNDVVISVENVAFHPAAAVPHSFATSKFSSDLDVHMHFPCPYQG